MYILRGAAASLHVLIAVAKLTLICYFASESNLCFGAYWHTQANKLTANMLLRFLEDHKFAGACTISKGGRDIPIEKPLDLVY